ncbi:MAG: GHKL domain-containing protein [Candidatus Latescibacteria bacterium]|nr:GHKL domain-containing protein [Candidatus Latescibacterota bacterium]MBT5830878.1 GHKL domain-containing protein [Candidatus Latescibacterota bacterium]
MESDKGDHGALFKRSAPISEAFILVVVGALLLLGLSVSVLIAARVVAVVDNTQVEAESQKMEAMVNAIDRFLNQQTILLQDHARFPIITQSVMQPEQMIGQVRDFMVGLSFLGKQYQLALLSFDGETINATREVPQFDYVDMPWVNEILENKVTEYRSVNQLDGHFYWRIAVPVIYNHLAEGILVMEIPAVEIQTILPSFLNPKNSGFEILIDGQKIIAFGLPAESSTRSYVKNQMGLTMHYRVDRSAVVRARNRLQVEIAIVVVVVMVPVLFVVLLFGKRFLVLPLQLLSDSASRLAEGKEAGFILPNQRIRELARLAKGFNHMALEVRRRESALLNNHAELEKTHAELKQAQVQLLQSEKMASIGQLAAGVAHEINNPLGFVKSSLGRLREYTQDLTTLVENYGGICRHIDESDMRAACDALQQLREFESKIDASFKMEDMPVLVDDAARGVERVAKIVQDLREFSHVDKPNEQIFNLNSCLKTTLTIVWHELKYKASVKTDYGPIPDITGHPMQLNQVFVNLLVNAAQAIEDFGEISVCTFEDDKGHVCVAISDTGCGMSEDVQKRIFEPFFTTKEVGQGMGLGLSMCYNIVKRHQGEIQVDSQEGKGSTIVVSLPKDPS